MRMRNAMNIVTMSHSRVFSWVNHSPITLLPMIFDPFPQGANSYGQLGTGHRIDSLLPVQCLLSDEVAQTVVSLAGGGGHTLLLTS